MAARPNLLLITCHDLGRFLGCYGNETVQSPALDRLAAEGVRFAQTFCTAPQCSPSRASLFTGRYPHSNGVLGLTHAQFAWDLHPDERHLGRILREAGYTTALAGVHHESRAGTAAEITARCGMDEILAQHGMESTVPKLHGDRLTDAALGWLDRVGGGERPWYLQIGYHEPHRVAARARTEDGYMGFIGDYLAPDEECGVAVPPYLQDTATAREELAELQGAVRALDAAVGRLLDGLRERGLAERTIVVFTTDHGLALPRAKCSLYDPGLETALLLRAPGVGVAGGRVLDPLMSNVDLLPTLLDLLSVPVPENVQGRSVAPALTGGRVHSARGDLRGDDLPRLLRSAPLRPHRAPQADHQLHRRTRLHGPEPIVAATDYDGRARRTGARLPSVARTLRSRHRPARVAESGR